MDATKQPSTAAASVSGIERGVAGTDLSRRTFLRMGAGVAGTMSLAPLDQADGRLVEPARVPQTRALAENGYRFLDLMMDAYQQRGTLRLIQSYADQNNLGSTAFTYDNALAIVAYLLGKQRDDLSRARLLGDSLLYAQQHDPQADGRLRQAYWVGPFTLPFTSNNDYFIRPDGSVNLVGTPWFFTGSAVGDMAWAAIALAQLAARTRDRRYLDGATALGEWIVTNAFSDSGFGGYSFGADANNNRVPVKSTEHNIDVYGLFNNLLAPLTGNAVWRTRAQHARLFLEAMWNSADTFFWTGTNVGPPETINKLQLPEDPQSWSYLALRDPRYAAALDWAKTNLATTDTPQSANAGFSGKLRFNGVTFSNLSLRITEPAGPFDPAPDPDAVWFEGTAQMAAALLDRLTGAGQDLATFKGDVDTAESYLEQIRLAQTSLGREQTVNGKVIPEGLGVVSASSVLNTGFGFSYFPSLHIGATAWALIAAASGNPFQLGLGR